jgi:UDP-N-acetylmuramate dehydrogenase
MVREQVALAGYTTLGLGGPAARLVEADSDEQIVAAVRAADQRGDPVLVLGGGSNLVVADAGFPGTVVQVATRGIVAAPDGDRVAVSVAAGEDWDAVVSWCVGSGLSGLECLSGIPGLAGATPIQNVGAYGQDVAETLSAVRAYDRQRDVTTELSNADCGFGYRTSRFKHAATKPGAGGPARAAAGAAAGEATGRFVVLGVTFRLASDPLSAPVRYGELARALGVAEGGRVPLAAAREAVLRIRKGKGMVLDPADPDTRSAGSFFTNPVLDRAQLAALERAAAAACGSDARVPRFPAGPGLVKIPAAWLIERAGYRKGYPGNGRAAPGVRPGQAGPGPRISAKHTLALVNPGGATATSLLALARDIRNGVHATFGVELVTEPVLVGAAL